MSDPLSVVQPAVRAALIAHAPVTAVVGQRIYDRVPSGATFPYLRIDIPDVAEDDNDCGENWEITAQVHIWSRAVGRQQASLLAGPVRAALDAIPASLTGYIVTVNQYRSTRLIDDPDGLTTHVIVEQRLRIRRSA